ncbi:MAG: protoporphyrinogen oxidase [Planctomycetes bacterium]|nr:protoporphyrinogen oxidase [Planctomycetota bacterium]
MSVNWTADRPWRVAIVGGGLAGLTAAYRLDELCRQENRPHEFVMFEATSQLGGIVGTRQMHGYTVELGADSFITNKPWAVDLCRRLGIEGRLIPTDARYRRSLVLRKGKPVPVPDGFQLLAPVNVATVFRSPIFSWPGKLRLACEYLIPRGAPQSDESLASFARRRFGQEALERLIQPMVGGIYTSDPEKLSLRATMPRFLEMEQAYGSVIKALRSQEQSGRSDDKTASGARYGLFATPAGGISELVQALADRVLASAQVHLNAEITALEAAPDGHGYVMQRPGQQPQAFDAVVLAIPAYRIADLVAGFAGELAQQLRTIDYASSAIVVSGHKLSDIRHPLDAFGLVVPAIEKRRILAVSFTSRKFPGRAPEGCVMLRTFVGGATQPELVKLSDAEILDLVREELTDILGVTWKPDFAIVARWMRSMPQYHVGHLDLVAKINRELAGLPRLALAGHAYNGVGIPDTVHSGEAAAERVFASS